MATAFESVGDILDRTDPNPPQPPTAFAPAVLADTPELPPPGIHFGIPEDHYHALPALSAHGIRKLASSPMVFWAKTPWLSEIARRREAERRARLEEKNHLTIGKAYHCRIMEGAEEFARRFAVELTEEECEGALEGTEQIKAAIARHQCQDTRKTAKPGDTVPVKPWPKVRDKMPDTDDEYLRSAVKADWIRQLLELEPDAKILDVLQQQHREAHAGKAFITADAYEQIEIAAKMIDADPEICHAFRDGHAEVTLIWTCPKTGVPMKARVDYLKLKAMVDLKSIANQRERSLENAIRFEIASYHYAVQPSVYAEAVDAVRKLVREQGAASVTFVSDELFADATIVPWVQKWAESDEAEWLWVFQQKGDAPVTRGVFYPLRGTTRTVIDDVVLTQKRRFRQFSETFGTDPWLDVKPIYDLADEDLPASATEI